MATDFQKASVRFITGIRYPKDMLMKLNNMTYIYDPNWNADNSTKATLPVCFYHVKAFHEVCHAEVSQKKMLFYNSQYPSTSADPSLNSGLLNVVADNITINPKSYKLDVVIPYHNLTLLDQSFVYNTHTMRAIAEELSNTKSNVADAMASWMELNSPYISFIKGLLRTLVAQDYGTSVEDFIFNTVHQPDYNKQSLELMWKLRHIVKMKVWNSWEYKYVAINDIDITKESTEDGVYEATITVQEVPIVSMYNQAHTLGINYQRKNPLLQARGEVAKNLLDAVGNGKVF